MFSLLISIFIVILLLGIIFSIAGFLFSFLFKFFGIIVICGFGIWLIDLLSSRKKFKHQYRYRNDWYVVNKKDRKNRHRTHHDEWSNF